MPSFITVDKRLPSPAYIQLQIQLSRAIASGKLAPGTALPSERELAEQLELSRMTVRRAFEELVAAGLLEQRQGSGTYVRAQPVEQTIDRLAGFSDEASQLGFRPGGRTLEVTTTPADGPAAISLGIEAGEPVLRITRVRTAHEMPLALQVAHLPPRLADLSTERLEALGSLYRTIDEQFGIRPHRARQTVASRLSTPTEQRLLELEPGTPVLALERTTFDGDGVAFEYVRSAYRGDRYRMALDLRASPAGEDGG
ncbi:MAG TPA: GntR family transcriptional regulator [Trueperaceae bacterium]